MVPVSMIDVFISYSHQDSAVARELAAGLEAMGVSHFLDEKSITWGTPLTETVRRALDECCSVVVIVSPASLASAWVPYEVGHAFGANSMGANKSVLPIVIDPAMQLPGYLADIHNVSGVAMALDFFRSPIWHEHCRESRRARDSDITMLRTHLTELSKWLTIYTPGAREPEDL